MECAHVYLIEVPIWNINVNHIVQLIVNLDELMGHSDPEGLHRMHVLRVFGVGCVLHHVVSDVVTVIVANDGFVDLCGKRVMVDHGGVLDELEVVLSRGGHFCGKLCD